MSGDHFGGGNQTGEGMVIQGMQKGDNIMAEYVWHAASDEVKRRRKIARDESWTILEGTAGAYPLTVLTADCYRDEADALAAHIAKQFRKQEAAAKLINAAYDRIAKLQEAAAKGGTA